MKNLMKNKKVLIALSLIMVTVIIMIIIRKRKNSLSESGDIGSGVVGTSLPTASFPLQPYSMAGEYSAAKGSYGQQIANLQKLCNSKYGTSLAVDGKFGPRTDEAFRNKLGTLIFSCRISESQYKIFMNRGDGDS